MPLTRRSRTGRGRGSAGSPTVEEEWVAFFIRDFMEEAHKARGLKAKWSSLDAAEGFLEAHPGLWNHPQYADLISSVYAFQREFPSIGRAAFLAETKPYQRKYPLRPEAQEFIKPVMEDLKLVERLQNAETPSESGSVDIAEVDRHRESADVDLKCEMEPRREDVPPQNVFNQEEVLDEQQLLNQERNFIVVQVGADCSQIKEEQEDICISQEGEKFGLKQETHTFDEDFPEQHVSENKFSPDQQLWNQEENSGFKQEESEPPHVKEEQEELCISQVGEQLVVKLEADTFMGTLISEEKQQSEAEPNSEQLLSHNSAGTEIQNEEGSWHVDSGSTKEEEEEDPKPKKRRLKIGSHHEEVPQLHNCKEEEVLTVHQLCNQERNSGLDQEEKDAAQVKEEEEELSSSQEEEDFGLKQETDTFMRSSVPENYFQQYGVHVCIGFNTVNPALRHIPAMLMSTNNIMTLTVILFKVVSVTADLTPEA
ncbi:uncharacterized protein KZ484_010907 [Pholidichthys leucotaenia]